MLTSYQVMKEIQISQNDNASKYLKCVVNLDTEYPDNKSFLSYDGKNIALKGEISAFVGKPKARKSFFVTLMMRYLLGEDEGKWKSDFNGKCLYFDSEQSRSRVKRIMRRLEIMGVDPRDHIFRSVRTLSVDEKLEYLDVLLKENKDVEYVIIDNIRDLLPSGDINNQADATQVVARLVKIAEDRGCHISVVLHTNPQPPSPGEQPKPSGAVGTRLTQVCSSVIYVEKKDDETSSVSPMEMRDGDFESFAFKIDMFDADAIPVYVETDPRIKEMELAKQETKLAKKHYEDQDKMKEMLKSILDEHRNLNTEGLRDMLWNAFHKLYNGSVPVSRDQMRKDIPAVFRQRWNIITKDSAKSAWKMKADLDLPFIQ